MRRENLANISVFLFLVALAIWMRLASNAWQLWNFAPVTATALFAGFYFSRRWVAVLVPLSIMVLSNLILPSYSSVGMMIVVYIALVLPVMLRAVLRKRLSVGTVGLCAAGSSLAFFLITNFAHWVLLFPVHSWGSLLTCYVDALPFYKWTVASDLVWSAVLFGSYVVARRFGYLPMAQADTRVRA